MLSESPLTELVAPDSALAELAGLLREDGSYHFENIGIIVKHLELSHDHLVLTLLLSHSLLVHYDLSELYNCRIEQFRSHIIVQLTIFDALDLGDFSLHLALYLCNTLHYF